MTSKFNQADKVTRTGYETESSVLKGFHCAKIERLPLDVRFRLP